MNCRTFLKRHCAFVDDTVSGVELAEMRLHVSSCRKCALHDARVRRALLVVRNLPQIEPSAGFREILRARLAATVIAPDGSAIVTTGRLLAAAAILIAATAYLAREHGLRRDVAPLSFPPVVASAPELSPSPVGSPVAETPAIAASFSAGLAVWPAALVAEQAPVYFVNAAAFSNDLTR